MRRDPQGKARLFQRTSATLLPLAATLEQSREHPLADAIARGARERGVPVLKAESFESVTGHGITGRVEGKTVAVENARLFEALKINLTDLPKRAEPLRSHGQTVMLVVVDGCAIVLLAVVRAPLHIGKGYRLP